MIPQELVDYFKADNYVAGNTIKGKRRMGDIARASEPMYCNLINILTLRQAGEFQTVANLIANAKARSAIVASTLATEALLASDIALNAIMNNHDFVLALFNSPTWAKTMSSMSSHIATNAEKYAWLVGKTKTLTMSDRTTVDFVVVGVGHDVGTDGNKVGLSFMSVPIIAQHYMNPTNVTTGGWQGSAMRTWLANELFPTFPADVKRVMKPVKKKYCATTTYTNVSESIDTLWLASQRELVGDSTYGVEGEQYAFWAAHNTNADRIKYFNSSAQWWWLRSVGSSGYFRGVGTSGSPYNGNASGSGGVSPGFAI